MGNKLTQEEEKAHSGQQGNPCELHDEELGQVAGGVNSTAQMEIIDVVMTCPKCHSTDLEKSECATYIQYRCNQCQHRIRIKKIAVSSGTNVGCSARY